CALPILAPSAAITPAARASRNSAARDGAEEIPAVKLPMQFPHNSDSQTRSFQANAARQETDQLVRNGTLTVNLLSVCAEPADAPAGVPVPRLRPPTTRAESALPPDPRSHRENAGSCRAKAQSRPSRALWRKPEAGNTTPERESPAA